MNGFGTWDVTLIQNLFPPSVSEAILNICIPQREEPNVLMWAASMTCKFSVSSAHRVIHVMHSPSSVTSSFKWSHLWKSSLHHRHKLLIWKLLSNCLATKERLQYFISSSELHCCVCGCDRETISHSFIHRPLSILIWVNSAW